MHEYNFHFSKNYEYLYKGKNIMIEIKQIIFLILLQVYNLFNAWGDALWPLWKF